MKKFFVAPAAIVLSIGLLSACNPLSLLGPIEAADPLGFAGQEATGTMTTTEPTLDTTSAQLTAKAVGVGYVLLEKTVSFDDPKDLPATPNILNLGLELSSVKIGGTGCTATLPDTITGNLTGRLKLKDTKTNFIAILAGGDFALSKQAAGGYSFAMGRTKEIIYVVVTKIGDLIGNKISPNTATVSFKMALNNTADLSGCSLKVTFGSGKSTFQF